MCGTTRFTTTRISASSGATPPGACGCASIALVRLPLRSSAARPAAPAARCAPGGAERGARLLWRARSILALAMSPKSDAFLSASADKSIRFWDLRTNVCAGRLACGPTPSVAYDHQARRQAEPPTLALTALEPPLACGARRCDVRVAGCARRAWCWPLRRTMASSSCSTRAPTPRREHNPPCGAAAPAAPSRGALTRRAPAWSAALQGPFDTFALQPAPGPPLSGLRFSLDGKMLLAVGGGAVRVLDAYKGTEMYAFHPVRQAAGAAAAAEMCAPEATVSPDGQYVLAGGGDNKIHCWSARTGREVGRWQGHAGMPLALKWAPRRCVFASGCTEGGLALWIPPPPAAG